MGTAAEKVVEAFGGSDPGCKKAAADLIGVSPQVISYWLKKGRIPSAWHKTIMEKAAIHKKKIKPVDLLSL